MVWLPSGLTFATSTAGDWTCNAAGQVVTCSSYRPINPLSSSTCGINVQVSNPAVPIVEVNAIVSNESDDDGSDNQAKPVTVIAGKTGVDIAVDGSARGIFQADSTQAYELSITNVGTLNTSAPIELTSAIPSGTSFISAAGAGWSCAAAGQLVTCSNPISIPAGLSSSLIVSILVSKQVSPESINIVSASSNGDTNPYNNWVPIRTRSVPTSSGFLISSNDSLVGSNTSTGKITVIAGASAGSWTAVSDSPSWLHITSGTSGAGSGEVQFQSDPNGGANPRSGLITVAGIPYSVAQAGSYAGNQIKYLSASDESGLNSSLSSTDDRSRFSASRKSKYFDLCELSRFYGAALQVVSAGFNPQLFLYDTAGRLVAHSAPSYVDRNGERTNWIPGLSNVSGNNYNIGFLRFPAGEHYTLEVTSDPTPGNPGLYGGFQLRIVKSLRDIVTGLKSKVSTLHTLSPPPHDYSEGTFYQEDYLSADLRRGFSVDMILRNVTITGLDARPVTLLNLGFQLGGHTKSFYDIDSSGTFKMFDPPDLHFDSHYVGSGTLAGDFSVFGFGLKGKIFHNLQIRDFELYHALVEQRCPPPTISPATLPPFGPGETTGTISISTASDCPWEACSDSNWITITSTSYGSGNGTITYTVSKLTGPSSYRFGNIEVNGRKISIYQST